MKLTKEHKEALRGFHFNYHKQIPTYTQDELIQYIVDNFDQILQNQEDAEKLPKIQSKMEMMEKSFEMINNDRNEIVGIKARLKKRIEEKNKKLQLIVSGSQETKCGSDAHLRILNERDELTKILEEKNES